MAKQGRVLEPPSTLAERAYDVIEEMIATLKLPPGAVFSEADLSERIKIGRTPMREALLRLAREHLIVMIPRRGVRVTDIKITDQLAVLEARRVLDRVIAEKAAERATPEQRERLHELAEEIVDAAKGKKLEEFMRLDGEFDRLLEKASKNPYAVQAVAPLHALCRRFWFANRHKEEDKDEVARHHAVLMIAVADADPRAAAKASDRLLDHVESFTRSAMDLS